MIRKNIFSILVALILLYLSLSNPERFAKVQLVSVPHLDKLVHFGMYFLLMSVIIIEHRKNLRNPVNLFLFALIPLSYGILMEILQTTLTRTRTGDLIDAIFDTGGIVVSILLWLLIKPLFKEKIR
ncbi:MAG: VanZ family protein [Bacteroidales bacterium]|nr:VanZ family protein [Bacteroidales bacterium]MBK8882687.1 VanZ family protein [Bacteroidales bacterium]